LLSGDYLHGPVSSAQVTCHSLPSVSGLPLTAWAQRARRRLWARSGKTSKRNGGQECRFSNLQSTIVNGVRIADAGDS
jgi:hypothetical protein